MRYQRGPRHAQAATAGLSACLVTCLCQVYEALNALSQELGSALASSIRTAMGSRGGVRGLVEGGSI